MLIEKFSIAVADEAEMNHLAALLAAQIVPGCAIHLSGDLGAGKSTLCRSLIAALGYRGRVKSPTYTLVESYPLALCTLYHFDLYRLADPSELEYIGYRDYFDQQSICLVEWPEMAEDLLSDPDLAIRIRMVEERRCLDINVYSDRGARLAGALRR